VALAERHSVPVLYPKPADLPMVEPTKVEFLINPKTAAHRC
jgi:hypothetical protein